MLVFRFEHQNGKGAYQAMNTSEASNGRAWGDDCPGPRYDGRLELEWERKCDALGHSIKEWIFGFKTMGQALRWFPSPHLFDEGMLLSVYAVEHVVFSKRQAIFHKDTAVAIFCAPVRIWDETTVATLVMLEETWK